MKLEQIIESLLSNNSNLETLIPIAIDALSKEILLKSKFYEGDLLMTILLIDKVYWQNNNTQFQRLNHSIETQFEKITQANVSFEMKADWYEKIELFKNITPD